jgi:hypothetical protein
MDDAISKAANSGATNEEQVLIPKVTEIAH